MFDIDRLSTEEKVNCKIDDFVIVSNDEKDLRYNVENLLKDGEVYWNCRFGKVVDIESSCSGLKDILDYKCILNYTLSEDVYPYAYKLTDEEKDKIVERIRKEEFEKDRKRKY